MIINMKNKKKNKKKNNKIKLECDYILPSYAYKNDAACDIYMPEQVVIEPNSTVYIDLKIRLKIPKNYACMIIPRSSCAKRGLIVSTSIIDSGYTGNIHAIIINTSAEAQYIFDGQRICSLLLIKINHFSNLGYIRKKRNKNKTGSSGK